MKTVKFTMSGEMRLDPSTFSKDHVWTDEDMIRFELSRLSDMMKVTAIDVYGPYHCDRCGVPSGQDYLCRKCDDLLWSNS